MNQDARGALTLTAAVLALGTAWLSWGCPALVDHAITSQRAAGRFPRHFTVKSSTCGGLGTEPCQSWLEYEKPKEP